MTLDLSPDDLLATTRTVRKRLDFERPVPRELIEECVQLAAQAPTGSNRQGWHFVFVSDPGKKQALADLYGKNFDPYASAAGPQWPADDPRAHAAGRVRESSIYLRHHMHEAPWLLVPCIEGRIPADNAPVFFQASVWGSLLPAVWSFMLAARARGLGTAWTTLHLPDEAAAAEVLGIPFDRVMQGGLIPVAFTKGTDFKPAPRLPTERIIHWEQW